MRWLLLLILCLAATLVPAAAACRWSATGGPGPHLAAGFFGAAALTAATGRPVMSALIVNGIGALKEASDAHKGGWCSGKDLLANAIGSWAGATYGLHVYRNERGVTMVSYVKEF